MREPRNTQNTRKNGEVESGGVWSGGVDFNAEAQRRRDEWFGDVPEKWVVKRLASYFSERKVKVSDKVFSPLSVTKNGILPQLENVAKSDDGDNRKLVRKGDFVINSRSDRKGSSGVSNYDGSVSLINLVLQPRGDLFGSYCNYLLKSLSFVEENYRNGRGIVADLWTTRYDEMKMIKVAMPPLSEQKAIVKYLDAETGRIDKAIAAEEKMIALLQERREIVINEAVSGSGKCGSEGIDFNAEAQRRRGWEVRKAKYLWQQITTPSLSSNKIGLENIEGSTGRFVESVAQFEGDGIEFKKGDILYGKLRPYLAKVWVASCSGNAVGDFFVYRLESCIDSRFIQYYLLSSEFTEMATASTFGAKMPRVSAGFMANALIPLPPLSEQEEIVKYLDAETGKIDRAIEVKRRQIELLRERRQIVIDEAVTGKVKVA